ncbi:hypothetical protein GQ55_7G287600 [Panicum hallii var. hallii]|uniref:BED-type domain-containing protein n=1 Tax=Panicum hallii var. hallii TaxID=1504633 RepID=A0A2T7D049_9POAL|nr:hypothetical protein GQ55_7G287600 [Panicum hallii var. hallii]
MEVVDPHVEAAVLWLAQTIMEVLFAGEMEAWIRQVGVADDTERLKSEIERVEAVIAAVKGRAAENRPLARSLGRLKELLYDADDMVDELDYYRLQHQVQGGTIALDNQSQGTDATGGSQLVDGSRDNPGVPNRNDRKKRSKAWEEFSITEEDADGKPLKAECTYCHKVVRCETTKGTSVLHNHLKSENCKRKRAAIEQAPIPSSADLGAQNGASISPHDSDRRKRMRSDEVLEHNIAENTLLWDKAEICNRIKQATHQLEKAISEVQKLHGSGSVSSWNLCQNTAADPCRRTSSLVQRKMYGRVDEKNSIIQHMRGDKPDSVIVLPIVGIGGIGKTALAQIIYNEPTVKSLFDYRIWIWVSSNFDEVRLTMEMLDFISHEKCVGISSLAKLQEILVTHVTSKRTLLILDDVWDDIVDSQWNKLLAPLSSDNAKGNVIIVTTRKLSIAKRIGTVQPIELGSLQNDDFWLLFETCAFGDENYKEYPSLTTIGQEIAERLQGNPLAAETTGMLLREQLTIDHWSNILKNEKWKSLQLNGGIMHALKLSYDGLPYCLQQCFSYCSIFPNNHQFLSNQLVCIWISQGFVKCSHWTKRLEEIGQNYLTDLLNSGFFKQVETLDPTLGDQTFYVMPPLMHDFARLVSGTECAAIDDLACREVLPTIRHLSILTDSAYHEDQHGNILRNERFEEKSRGVVNSMRKLRTLVLIGKYDYFFLESLQGIFQKAQNLRVLQISATYANFGYSACNLVNSTHVRYLKLRTKEDNEVLPEALSKFYHLQVLDIGLDRYSTVPNSMNNLISLRHLVASKAVYSSINSIGKMTTLQELHDYKVDNCTSSGIAQLQSMSELAQLGVSQLEKVVTREEAYGAKLREKSRLEKLRLSWGYTFSLDEYNNDRSKEVFEGLEPHQNLKHLQICGYGSTTSPDWLVSSVSVTCLQTLHLEDCRELQVLPSLERLPLLTKLKLRNMRKVRQVTVPSLEELVLTEMPELEGCSCNSVRDLNSSLRVLTIERCGALKVFPLFESCAKIIIEQKSWLSGLRELTIHVCPNLTISHALPPSSRVCRLSIAGVSTLPEMKGSTNGELTIRGYLNRGWDIFSGSHDKPTKLDDNFSSFHHLRAITSLRLVSCLDLFSPDVLPVHAHEDMADANFNALPSLKHLETDSCGITGRWLSMMLRHAPALEELHLEDCNQISGLLMEETESHSLKHTSTPRASSASNPDDALTSSTPEGLVRIPSNLIPSLKKLIISSCDELTFQGDKDGFSRFTSLEELRITGCPKLIPSLVHKYENNDQRNGRWPLPLSLVELEIDGSPETLQPCFLEGRDCLKKLHIHNSPSLKLLQLRSCTALEGLTIQDCESLTTLEGNFTCLKELVLRYNSGLESLQLRSCTALEGLTIEVCQSLTTLEGNFTCLKELVLRYNLGLESLQLRSYTALEGLTIEVCQSLTTLEGNFTCLKELVLRYNSRLESLQLRSCTALEGLTIQGCESLTTLEGNFTCLKELVLRYNSGLESLQLRSCTALEGLTIQDCESLTTLEGNFTCLKELVLRYNSGLESLQLRSCTALEGLTIQGCESLTTLEGNFTCLKKLVLRYNSGLESLQLRSCTALEGLTIQGCESLTTLEGNFTCLKELVLRYNSGLESLHLYSCTALEGLTIQGCVPLTTLEGNFTCLRNLELRDNPRLKSVRLRFCTALEELLIEDCESLAALEDLSLRGLRYLRVFGCPSLSHYLEGLSSQGRDQLCAELEIG